MPREISIIVVRNLAAGFCFFDGKMDLARHYAKKSCEMAERIGSRNFLAASRFILGYIGLLSGDTRRARMEIEKSYGLASDPLVGMSNRLTLHIMQLCELSMSGSFEPFLYHKNLVLKGVDQEIVRQTVAAPYLHVWSAIGLIENGRLADALDVIEQGMMISKTAASEHMTSQLLQWRAFIHALHNDKGRALDDIELATEMRGRAGGPFFLGFHSAVKGAVLTFLGHDDKARQNLDLALEIGEQIPSPYIQVCARAYLCYLDLRAGDEARAESRLRSLLEQMIEFAYDYFWGWESDMMLRLLSEAVKRNIEPDFARRLAEERLNCCIEANGKTIPMLMIRILGTFSISIDGVQLFSLRNLSNHQRELFGLLISSPELRISQDQIQLALWPDSPPDKASKTFYTLISRLRKVLAEKIDDPTRYISVEKGYVQLKNCCVDASTFLNLARKGLSLTRRELLWQAGNAFHTALSCWHEFSDMDIFQGEQILDYIDEIHHVLRKVCLTWAHALAARNRIDEALALLEKTDKVLSSDEDRIVLQHKLYIEKKKPLKA
ncbi:MAG: winged helix-turn-helix domain-containing protein, partial [Desulfofustis sp.]